MKNDAMLALIRETLFFLNHGPLSKQHLFATKKDYAFFLETIEDVREQHVISHPQPSNNPSTLMTHVELPRKSSSISSSSIHGHPHSSMALKPLSPIKKTLQKIAPQLRLVDQIPSDLQAKRIANAWREKWPAVEVVLLACETQTETLDFLKNLARAIDQHLAKCKVMIADRLEQEKGWDFFLEKNSVRLILASSGIKRFPHLMHRTRFHPANSEPFLGHIPLLILSPVSIYKSLEQKAHLWKTLCEKLKK